MDIPEEIETSFEELWRKFRLEFEQAETKALNDSDETPVIKVIKFYLSKLLSNI